MVDNQYVATLRVQFNAQDEVEAQLLAHEMISDINVNLVESDGEDALVTQISSTTVGVTPEELLVNFRATRNALIRTRYQPCVSVAQELDKVIQALRQGSLDLTGPYDYGEFMDIVKEVLEGGNPQ